MFRTLHSDSFYFRKHKTRSDSKYPNNYPLQNHKEKRFTSKCLITEFKFSRVIKQTSAEPGVGRWAFGSNSFPCSWMLIFWEPKVKAFLLPFIIRRKKDNLNDNILYMVLFIEFNNYIKNFWRPKNLEGCNFHSQHLRVEIACFVDILDCNNKMVEVVDLKSTVLPQRGTAS